MPAAGSRGLPSEAASRQRAALAGAKAPGVGDVPLALGRITMQIYLRFTAVHCVSAVMQQGNAVLCLREPACMQVYHGPGGRAAAVPPAGIALLAPTFSGGSQFTKMCVCLCARAAVPVQRLWTMLLDFEALHILATSCGVRIPHCTCAAV